MGITGNTGVLGRIICSRFENAGIDVKSYSGDIIDMSALSSWFYKNHFDFFFHFAAIVPINIVNENPIKAFEVNAIGTYNVSKLIIETQSNCWLFLASSSHVYKSKPANSDQKLKVGDDEFPESLYGISKLASEKISIPLLKYFKIAHCVGRIFSFTGIEQKEPFLVPTLIRKIKELPNESLLEIKNHTSIRDLIDAETVIDCILYLAQERYNEIINIGSGRGKSIEEIAKKIAKNYKKEINIKGINSNNSNALVADINELNRILKNG